MSNFLLNMAALTHSVPLGSLRDCSALAAALVPPSSLCFSPSSPFVGGMSSFSPSSPFSPPPHFETIAMPPLAGHTGSSGLQSQLCQGLMEPAGLERGAGWLSWLPPDSLLQLRNEEESKARVQGLLQAVPYEGWQCWRKVWCRKAYQQISFTRESSVPTELPSTWGSATRMLPAPLPRAACTVVPASAKSSCLMARWLCQMMCFVYLHVSSCICKGNMHGGGERGWLSGSSLILLPMRVIEGNGDRSVQNSCSLRSARLKLVVLQVMFFFFPPLFFSFYCQLMPCRPCRRAAAVSQSELSSLTSF